MTTIGVTTSTVPLFKSLGSTGSTANTATTPATATPATATPAATKESPKGPALPQLSPADARRIADQQAAATKALEILRGGDDKMSASRKDMARKDIDRIEKMLDMTKKLSFDPQFMAGQTAQFSRELRDAVKQFSNASDGLMSAMAQKGATSGSTTANPALDAERADRKAFASDMTDLGKKLASFINKQSINAGASGDRTSQRSLAGAGDDVRQIGSMLTGLISPGIPLAPRLNFKA
jgi:hypothetical protein